MDHYLHTNWPNFSTQLLGPDKANCRKEESFGNYVMQPYPRQIDSLKLNAK